MASVKGERADGMLIVIGAFKLLKAAMLVALALGFHHLLHRDVGEVFQHWAHAVRIDPHSQILQRAISLATGLSQRRLEELSVGTLIYAALFATEGTGLLLRKRWAEYLTIISTAGLLPLEMYELIHHPTIAKTIILVANLAIVAYLIVRLWMARRRAAIAAGPAQSA